jgi:hypothetical protein
MRITAENALLDLACQNPEIAPFAYFELDASQAVDPQTGEAMFPELGGKHTPLWSITSNEGGAAKAAAVATRQREAEAHRQRVQVMADRVASGLSPLEEGEVEQTETPSDEWADFWGGASPTERGYV